MAVPVKPIVLYQGADYEATGSLSDDDGPIDIENDTFVAEIKENINDSAPVVASFVIAVFEDTSVVPAQWKYTRTMTDTVINALTIKDGVWDQFRIQPGGTRSKMLRGSITVQKKVTES